MFNLMEFHRFALVNVEVLLQCSGALGVQLTLDQLGPALLPGLSLGPGNVLSICSVWEESY